MQAGIFGGGDCFQIKWGGGERERGTRGRERGTKQCNKLMENVARTEEMKKSESLKGRDQSITHRHRDNIKRNRKGTGCEHWDSIPLAPVSIAMKLPSCALCAINFIR
jgi:hypothetical protein